MWCVVLLGGIRRILLDRLKKNEVAFPVLLSSFLQEYGTLPLLVGSIFSMIGLVLTTQLEGWIVWKGGNR